jgi:hypothetical protein
MLRLVAFQMTTDEGAAEITVSTASGEMLANVNRWRGQIDLPPMTSDQLSQVVKPLRVDSTDSQLVQLIDTSVPSAIVVAVVPRPNQTFFIKLMGDRPVVIRELDKFQKFVQSIQFTSNR